MGLVLFPSVLGGLDSKCHPSQFCFILQGMESSYEFTYQEIC